MPIYDECQQSNQSEQREHAAIDNAAEQEPTDHANQRTNPSIMFNPFYTGRHKSPVGGAWNSTVDREEIIRRIKSREDRSRTTSPELGRQRQFGGEKSTSEAGKTKDSSNASSEAMDIGMQIERPKSALHRGDFREKQTSPDAFSGNAAHESHTVLSTSPQAPWHAGFQISAFRQAWSERRSNRAQSESTFDIRQRTASAVAPGYKLFYQAPTSPLVQSSRPETPPPHLRRSSRSPDKQSRRHTFSPQALQRFASDPSALGHVDANTTNSLRTEATYSYQAHQPRRSLHTINAIGSPSTYTVALRRPSISSDAHSPLHHAPMVGSYEESILRGRMSTTPSKPLNFIAQIGVLGKGTCKPNLRCPPHATVPFPAVFYSYGIGNQQDTDQPSPYVGLVDLESGLPSHEETLDRRRQHLGQRLRAALSDDADRSASRSREDDPASGPDIGRASTRRRAKVDRRSGSPKAPPGGAYRIPQQGQLQIVIKNPNKTAVKLFLIPYDLSDMVSGQKTFIRQRSYSAGPIIDMPLSFRNNLGTDRPEASLTTSDDPNERPILRYLVHLHICCTGKGRYWLYKSIRVVFANRVPDGREKLRHEIQLPEPKYSSYRPIRESNVTLSPPCSPSAHTVKPISDINRTTADRVASSCPSTDFGLPAAHEISTFQFPFRAPLLATLESRPSSRHNETMDVDSDLTRSDCGTALSPTSSCGNTERPMSPARGLEAFTFQRDHSRERTEYVGHKAGESLLSQKLKQLDM